MGKKRSKRRMGSRVVNQLGEAARQCPYCRIAKGENSDISLLDQLFRSHVELCEVLRLAGRQMLRFEQQGDDPLEKIRAALKRAEHVRKAMESADYSPEALMHRKILSELADVSAPVPRYHDGQPANDDPIPSNVQLHRRTRLTRVLKFPVA
jgi:hypothetical protein